SRKSSYNALMKAFQERRADILVGSRMVAGAGDLPPVAVAGIMSADLTLNLPDFRSAERTFQALEEMSGAAGSHRDGISIIQTYDGGPYSIAAACEHDFEAFYENEIESRREIGYPPFGHLVNIVIWNRSEVTARALGKEAAKRLAAGAAGGGYEVLGPGSAPYSRLRGWSRWRVLMKGRDRTAMAGAARDVSREFEKKIRSTGSRMSIDVDPVSML
ncbi:MAG: primosomal protein N', partial [Bacillota bacterium]